MDRLVKKIRAPQVRFDRFGQLLFTLRELLKIVRKINLRLVVILFFVSAFAGLLAVPGFYLEKLFLDTLIQNIGTDDWTRVLGTISLIVTGRILLALLRTLLDRVSSFLQRMLAQLFDAYLDAMMAQKLGELDLATIEDPAFKDRFTKIQQDRGRRAWGLMMPFASIIDSSVGFLSAIVVLVFFNPLIAMGAIIVSLPRFFIDSKYIKREYQLAKDIAPLHKKWGWLNYYLIRNRNFMEVKLLGLQGFLTKQLMHVQKQSIDAQIALRRERMLSNFWSTIPLSVLELGLTIWLGLLVIGRYITLGSAQLYIRSLGSAQGNLNQLMNSLLEIYENYLYVVDLVWLLDLKPKIDMNKKGLLAPTQDITIEFKDVWFKYLEDQDWILKGVSFKMHLHENLAIVGLNGSGKSTLIKLLARFYDPQKGEIYVNKQNLTTIDVASWRKRLAILFQEFETYVFSVEESIGFGDVDRLHQKRAIVMAAKATGMHEYVMNLPLKYKNPLHNDFPHGERPSGGQAQRLGIARMLFRKDAQVMIMDEPTSNVDPEAEEQIFNELVHATKKKILIFVTQRFSTVRLADRILVLEKGKIIELGKHEELLKNKSRYYELYKLQAKGYK